MKYLEEETSGLFFVFIAMVFKEFGCFRVFPLGEHVCRIGANEVDCVDDARDWELVRAEYRELNGCDALVQALIPCRVGGGAPLLQEVALAQGVHELATEELRFESALDNEELGVNLHEVLPDVFGVAEVLNGVKVGEHCVCEVSELLRVGPLVSCREHGEDDRESVVAQLLKPCKQSVNTLLGCRNYVLIVDYSESVRGEDKVELRHGVKHGISCDSHATVMQEQRRVVFCVYLFQYL